MIKDTRYKMGNVRYRRQDIRHNVKIRILCIVIFPFFLVPCIFSLLILSSCSQNHQVDQANVTYYEGKLPDLYQLAIRFAPRLYVNSKEPYNIKDLIVIIHPQKPLIAYHILWYRGILHTYESVMEAKINDQRSSFCVQWGQHGMLSLPD